MRNATIKVVGRSGAPLQEIEVEDIEASHQEMLKHYNQFVRIFVRRDAHISEIIYHEV